LRDCTTLALAYEMKHTFSSCALNREAARKCPWGARRLTLYLTGLDPSSLTNLQYAFSGCSALVTIYVDSTWILPNSGLTGVGTFYNSKAIVGGNGTTYSISN